MGIFEGSSSMAGATLELRTSSKVARNPSPGEVGEASFEADPKRKSTMPFQFSDAMSLSSFANDLSKDLTCRCALAQGLESGS